MPTKRFDPEPIPPGYEDDLSFSEQHVSELAEIIGKSPGDVLPALQKAARAITMLKYSERAPESEIAKSLKEAGKHAIELRSNIVALGPGSKKALLSAYDARERPARARLKTDLAALERLFENLTVAGKRSRPRRGRPPNQIADFAARKFIRLYEEISDRPFSLAPKTAKNVGRSFVMNAVRMLLDIDRKTASGAIDRIAVRDPEGGKN